MVGLLWLFSLLQESKIKRKNIMNIVFFTVYYIFYCDKGMKNYAKF